MSKDHFYIISKDVNYVNGIHYKNPLFLVADWPLIPRVSNYVFDVLWHHVSVIHPHFVYGKILFTPISLKTVVAPFIPHTRFLHLPSSLTRDIRCVLGRFSGASLSPRQDGVQGVPRREGIPRWSFSLEGPPTNPFGITLCINVLHNNNHYVFLWEMRRWHYWQSTWERYRNSSVCVLCAYNFVVRNFGI